MLQVEEMQDMRAEFTKTVEAARHQTFEATFFQMLRLHNHNVERIRWQYLERNIQKVKTKYINGLAHYVTKEFKDTHVNSVNFKSWQN